MAIEMGELLVGAYLKEIQECDFVDYNIRPPGGGLKGMHEFDVLGLRFSDGTAFLCEVATHLDGLNYGGRSNRHTLDTLARKHDRQRDYAGSCLGTFANHRFMLWSPCVPKGVLTAGLSQLQGLELVINADFARAVDALRAHARSSTRNTGNAFFRALQILEHLRG